MKLTKVEDFCEEIARYEIMKEYFSVNFETGLITRTKIITNDPKNKIGDNVKCKCDNGYIRFTFKGNNIRAHRFIFYCYHGVLYPIIDHENTIRDDNRILNLRGGTGSQNMQNQNKPHSNNKSGYLGVGFHKREQKYIAKIQINGKKKHLGYFTNPKEAHEAYLTAKRLHHEFCTI